MMHRKAFFRAIFILLPAWAVASPVSLSFYDSVMVTQATVRLSDIADLRCAADSDLVRLKDIPVAQSLIPGVPRNVSTGHVLGYCLRNWDKALWKVANQGTVYVRMDTRTVSADILREAAEKHIRSQMPWKNGEVAVRILRCPDALVIPNLPYTLQAETEKGYPYCGSGKIRLAVMQKGKEAASASLAIEVQVTHAIVTAARTIPRNTVIKSGDLAQKVLNITRLHSEAFTDPQNLIGSRVKRTVVEGRILDASMIEAPPLVQNGSVRMVLVKKNTAQVEVEGVCRADGRAGDRIPIYCMASRKLLKGLVQDDGSILIDETRRQP